jgi:hypothetical protein
VKPIDFGQQSDASRTAVRGSPHMPPSLRGF